MNELRTLDEIKTDVAAGKKLCYVYLLFKPDGTPFYVGKGRSNRISAHEAEARYFLNGREWRGINTLKINTIVKIWDNGDVVRYQIDSWHDDNISASQREIELVEQFGKRIANSGPLTNIRDGGDLFTEEDRRLIGERIRQHYIDHPEAREELSARIRQHYIDHPESLKKASARKTQYFIDHPEMKDQISDVLKNYCIENPEFIEHLQLKKNEWIQTKPEEYEAAKKKRLEICQSDSHREKVSNIMQEYFKNHPEELERLRTHRLEYFKNNPEAIEKARQNCIKNNSAQYIRNWHSSEDLKVIESRKQKYDNHSEYLKEWNQTELGRKTTKQAAYKRNLKFRTEEHRQHMANKTAEYIKNNPEADKIRREKARQTMLFHRQEKQKPLLEIQEKLFVDGKIKNKSDLIDSKKIKRWQKRGLIDSNLKIIS